MSNKYSRILIDMSNLYYRSYSVSSHLSFKTSAGKEIITGGVYTSLKMIQRIQSEFLAPDGFIYFLFDNTHSGDDKRKEIDPDYKANRVKKDQAFYKGLDLLHLILLSYDDNFIILKRPGSEADDLVSTLLDEFSKYEKVLLVSNDLDWARGLSENTHLAKYEKKDYMIYTPEYFEEKYGFYPTKESVILYKTFRGDDSDNIPKGVPGIRENILIKLIENYTTLQEILKEVDQISFLGDNWKKKIKENKPRLRLNNNLVSYQSVPFEELKEYMFYGEFRPSSLKSYYESLGFNVKLLDPRVFNQEEKKSFFDFKPLNRI